MEGDEAFETYIEHQAPAYVVLPNSFGSAYLLSETPETFHSSDYYVFPENMAWTMAFTHEEGRLGPYFAKHKDYENLNEKNEKQIGKDKQIQHAKEKGWM